MCTLQQLHERYNQHKKIIVQWENAFTKLEGRAPTKDDLTTAPEEVKYSNKRYLKIKRYYSTEHYKARLENKSPGNGFGTGKKTPKKKTPVKIFSRFNSRLLSSSSSSLECMSPSLSLGEEGSDGEWHGTGSGAIDSPGSPKKVPPKTPFYRKFSSKLYGVSGEAKKSSFSPNTSIINNNSSGNTKENKHDLSLNSSGEELQSMDSSGPFSRTNSAEFQEFDSEPLLYGTNTDFPLPNISKDCSPNIMRLVDSSNWILKKSESQIQNSQQSSSSVSIVITPENIVPITYNVDSQKLRTVDQSWLDRCLQNDDMNMEVDEDDKQEEEVLPIPPVVAELVQMENSISFTIPAEYPHFVSPAFNFETIPVTLVEPDQVVKLAKPLTSKPVNGLETNGSVVEVIHENGQTETLEIIESSSTATHEIPLASTPSTTTVPNLVLVSDSRPIPKSGIISKEKKQKIVSPIKLKRKGDVFAFVEDEIPAPVAKKSKPVKQKSNNTKNPNPNPGGSRKRRKLADDKAVTITTEPTTTTSPIASTSKKRVTKPKVSHPVDLDPTMRTHDIFDEVDSKKEGKMSARASRKRKREHMTKSDWLNKKIDTGRINENFVRIDITKKVFVRGRKKMTGQKMKRIEWKMKKSAANAESKIKLSKCRTCGEIGHFAKFCMKGKQQESKETENDNLVDDSPFPTLEEAARMVWSKKASQALENRTVIYKNSMSQDVQANDDDETESVSTGATEPIAPCSSALIQHAKTPAQIQIPKTRVPIIETLKPVLEPRTTIGSVIEEADLLMKGLDLFGYPSFRPGQQKAISRILRGQSTLVILSTGTGKSLCYMLPAYLYAQKYPGALTLCISPLVSLMEDQVQNMPLFLNGACLHTNMSEKQREKVLEKVRARQLNLLLVSPEAVCGGLFGLLRNVEDFPPIAFACIDEVHCVSQWSHNFRPSYLKLCKILREKLNVNTILGLTATATNQTTISICEHINTEPSQVIRGEIIPSNLRLSASRDPNREEALLCLLRGDRFASCASIIIYCTRREECERIATLIRTRLQDSGFNSNVKMEKARQRVSSNCEAYHAGMSATRRKLVQNQFMSGKIRIVVATVAFGMGIDKSDIRAVLHFNMPKTFESYVQEIGRSGRDGLPAECHLFLDNVKGKDLCELKRHVYSNSIDRPTVRKLLNKIFKPCKCENIEKIKGTTVKTKKECPGHEVSFSVQDIVRELDLPEENVETLLCYLELDTKRKWVEMLPKCYQLCTIQSYGGAKLFKTAAATCPALAVAIALQKERKKFKDDDVYLQFNYVEVAATVGWESATVRKELKSLEWTGTQFDDKGNTTKYRKSGFLVEFSDLAYRMIAPGNLTDEESDILLNSLHGHNYDQERTQLYQLHRVHHALQSVSVPNVGFVYKQYDEEKSDALKKFVFDYFQQSTNGVPASWRPPPVGMEKEESIRRDVVNLIASCKDHDFTSRAIAKIFQGIPSPNYSSQDWGRNRSFWRKYLDVDFHYLCQIAAQELS